MENSIIFSGLGIEVGQNYRGLIHSPIIARNYFSILVNAGLKVIDKLDIVQAETVDFKKIYSEIDLDKIHWNKFFQSYLKTSQLLNEDIPLLSWGGDHSVAISTVAAFTQNFPEGYVLWIDAHADINLPSRSLTGNLHGMPLSILMNLDNIAKNKFPWINHYLNPEQLIYIGLRDLDPFEIEIINKLKIKNFSFEEIQKVGLESILQKIIETIKGKPVHISFDIDSVDPIYAPSTGVPVHNGFSPEHLNCIGKYAFKYLNVRSLDVVEVNPKLGTMLEVDQSYITAFNFIKSVFTHNNEGATNESMGKRSQTEHFTSMEWGL
jgi:arginase